MADHTSITDTTSQPTLETPNQTAPDVSTETPEPPQPPLPYFIRGRVNQSLPTDRWKTRLALFTKIILQTFAGHAAKRHYKPRNQRRIRQIILHGAHADEQMVTRKGEPYMMLVTVNKLPHDIDTLLATITAVIHARWGMHVHIHLMRARQFKRGFGRASPFYKALTVCSEVLYSDGGNHPIMPPVAMPPPVMAPPVMPSPVMPKAPQAETLITAKVITPDKRPEETPDETPEDTPTPKEPEKPAPKEPKKKDRNWWDAPELWTYKAMHQRTEGTLSRDEAHMEMEEPLARLMGNTVLLRDLASGGLRGDDPQAVGLYSLAFTMRQQADMLYRLFHGRRSETYR